MKAFDFVEKSILAIECDSFHPYGKPTRDMSEIENVKITLVQWHMYNSVHIFSLVCYFPLHHQNNKKANRRFKKALRKF